MKKAIEAGSVSADGNSPQAVQPDYKLILWKDLQVSPTNPRRRINEQTIESLADSLRTQGVLEPLIVRENGKKYEIVCGERRYRAAEVAKVTELPCLVRELSDEEVLDIQIHENLHREDVHPMDEAYGYQFLKERLSCDVRELALRVGKSEGYVLNRLKLNLLIREAQKDIDDAHLPLTYALEIAKYTPEIQKYIYSEVYKKEGKYQKDNYVYIPIKGQTVPWKSFIEWINTNIHHLLSKAPFDTKAVNLRPDGLACVNCPERTGAAVSLFEPNQIGKKDACLNPACYFSKAQNHIEIRRRELAALANVEPSHVPIVRSFYYSDGEDFLGSESARVISGAKHGGSARNCKHAVSGIDIEADNYGQTVQVCLKSSGCGVHWRDSKSSSDANSDEARSAEDNAERLETHRARREEIWNAKVAEAVRVRVFKQAAERFEKKFKITEVGSDFLPQLLARFWRMTASGDSNNLHRVVRYLMGEWQAEPGNGDLVHVQDGRAGIEYFSNLMRGIQFRVLFLLIHGHKGTIGHANNYTSQKEVRKLAAEFDVDYSLIDAEVRLDLCTKKHKETHQVYLNAVREKSNDAKVPRPFSEKWKAGD
ncbi:MAG TPA: ParB/RepB/Spo0J family partition protein [Pyrinomonadaceae bacterium]|nr:ParB/RepB/Spo0J family partition protein [Pyrinomonadaceae bacterium]HMP65585.1 ParB/RepB/Spo0J family partition protein [Pyrinomonadaceae bacterium]